MTTDRYAELLERFPPRVIRTKAQLVRTEAEIETLLSRKDRLDESERAYLDLLTRLVEDWEDEHIEMPGIGGIELVKVLLADRELSHRDLVRAGVFATDSIASEVLAGRRSPTVTHVAKLAQYFSLPTDLFMPKETASRQTA